MKKPQPMLHGRRPHAASLIACVAIVFAFLLAGCAVRPQALKDEDVRKRTAADQYLLYAEQEPITGPIDVNTAIARALKYNLDYRLKLMERALATGLWEVSRYDMLPKVVASAGYAWRNNDSGGTSVSIINGQETLSPSTSQERNRWLANAEFSWNLLDFGVSYYQAKQKADETLISEERRRRVIQNIVQDTRSAGAREDGTGEIAPSRIHGPSAPGASTQLSARPARRRDAAQHSPPGTGILQARACCADECHAWDRFHLGGREGAGTAAAAAECGRTGRSGPAKPPRTARGGLPQAHFRGGNA